MGWWVIPGQPSRESDGKTFKIFMCEQPHIGVFLLHWGSYDYAVTLTNVNSWRWAESFIKKMFLIVNLPTNAFITVEMKYFYFVAEPR